MSINDATRFDWDRLREAHPPLVLDTDGAQAELHYTAAGNLSPSLLDKYIELADEEQRLKDLERPVYEEEEEDVVNHPNHYNTGIIECIEAIEESMTPEAYKGYLKGNCMKYLWRYDYKGKPVEDLEKAQWYLDKLIKVQEVEDE